MVLLPLIELKTSSIQYQEHMRQKMWSKSMVKVVCFTIFWSELLLPTNSPFFLFNIVRTTPLCSFVAARRRTLATSIQRSDSPLSKSLIIFKKDLKFASGACFKVFVVWVDQIDIKLTLMQEDHFFQIFHQWYILYKIIYIIYIFITIY